MEYAAGGELFDRISNAGRFSEDEVVYSLFISFLQFFSNSSIFLWLSWCLLQARFFFQQLISGVSYCHTMVSKSSTLRNVPFLITFYSIYLSWMKWDNFFGLFAPCLLMKQVCHRDLKLENTLLDGSLAPRLKICDFGYSKVLLCLSVIFLFVARGCDPQWDIHIIWLVSFLSIGIFFTFPLSRNLCVCGAMIHLPVLTDTTRYSLFVCCYSYQNMSVVYT